MNPKDIENPIAEADFRAQLKEEKSNYLDAGKTCCKSCGKDKMNGVEHECWAEEFDKELVERHIWNENPPLYDISFDNIDKIKYFIRTLLQAESDKMAAAIEMSKQGWVEQGYADLESLMHQGIEFESTFDGWRAYVDKDYKNELWAETLQELVEKIKERLGRQNAR